MYSLGVHIVHTDMSHLNVSIVLGADDVVEDIQLLVGVGEGWM